MDKEKLNRETISIKNFKLVAITPNEITQSCLDTFVVWHKGDKYPYIRKYKTIENSLFVDTLGDSWECYAILPKCFYCEKLRLSKCRGIGHNILCYMKGYNKYKGNKESIEIKKPYMTYKELSRWLSLGNGEALINGYVTNSICYKQEEENNFVSVNIKIRKWTGNWEDPFIDNGTN